MVQNFVEQEDNNYSLFNYLNVLSDEVNKTNNLSYLIKKSNIKQAGIVK